MSKKDNKKINAKKLFKKAIKKLSKLNHTNMIYYACFRIPIDNKNLSCYYLPMSVEDAVELLLNANWKVNNIVPCDKNHKNVDIVTHDIKGFTSAKRTAELRNEDILCIDRNF